MPDFPASVNMFPMRWGGGMWAMVQVTNPLLLKGGSSRLSNWRHWNKSNSSKKFTDAWCIHAYHLCSVVCWGLSRQTFLCRAVSLEMPHKVNLFRFTHMFTAMNVVRYWCRTSLCQILPNYSIDFLFCILQSHCSQVLSVDWLFSYHWLGWTTQINMDRSNRYSVSTMRLCAYHVPALTVFLFKF